MHYCELFSWCKFWAVALSARKIEACADDFLFNRSDAARGRSETDRRSAEARGRLLRDGKDVISLLGGGGRVVYYGV